MFLSGRRMVRVIVATMVKDEDDIVEAWIQYYGELFGYSNVPSSPK
jgi:hypothetical protein